jgi:hypothetical protein
MTPTTTITVDPIITWLERLRDFIGTTPDARAMAQRTIDRLRPPAPDTDTVIDALLDEIGSWRANGYHAVVSDRPQHISASAEDVGYYGGFLVAESMHSKAAIATSFLPQLLRAARENAVGRKVLREIAQTIATAPSSPEPVRDRLDGALRLAALGSVFGRSHLDFGDENDGYMVGEFLKMLAGALLTGRLGATREEVEAWLDRKREVRA